MPDAPSTVFAGSAVDLDRPSAARVYDFLLGGTAHWSIDRSFGQRLIGYFPQFRDIAQANRMFVSRVVRHLVRRGIRQFLDIGSGVLSEGNTHQIADELSPCRVVYVDNEPIAVSHAELLIDEDGDPNRHAVVDADLRCPDEVWHQARATGVLDLREPVAVLMFSVLHSIPPGRDGNDEATRAVAGYRALMPAGSYLGISHLTHEGIPEAVAPRLMRLKELCRDWSGPDIYCRSQSAIAALLGDFDVIPPGMVWTPQWHPEDARRPSDTSGFSAANHAVVWAGVGRKR